MALITVSLDWLRLSVLQVLTVCPASFRRTVYCFEGALEQTPDYWAARVMCVLPAPCGHLWRWFWNIGILHWGGCPCGSFVINSLQFVSNLFRKAASRYAMTRGHRYKGGWIVGLNVRTPAVANFLRCSYTAGAAIHSAVFVIHLWHSTASFLRLFLVQHVRRLTNEVLDTKLGNLK